MEPEPSPPTAAAVLTFIAGLLMIIDGALLSVAGGLIGGTAGGFVGTLGGLGILFGLFLFIFGFVLYVRPEHHLILGVLIIVVSLTSILSGGGFFLGLILGVVGGILAVVHDPD